jgi:hypothetical protein
MDMRTYCVFLLCSGRGEGREGRKEEEQERKADPSNTFVFECY